MGNATEDAYDAAPFVPGGAGFAELRAAAADCRGCPLHREAVQAVFGEGEPTARVVLVGEQPGDQEDRRGRPFVGPAGRLLDRALEEAGIDRGDAYVTNAVKHFTFTRPGSGNRRIHKPPSLREMRACSPWLEAELQLVDPDVLVALGATAGKGLLGSHYRVTAQRGRLLDRPDSPPVLGTVHPSAVLRADDRDAVYAGLVADLRVAAGAVHRTPG